MILEPDPVHPSIPDRSAASTTSGELGAASVARPQPSRKNPIATTQIGPIAMNGSAAALISAPAISAGRRPWRSDHGPRAARR